VTLSTVGYGDISPTTQLERHLSVIMLGAFVYAYIIGEFSDLITNMKKERSDFDARMRSVNELLAYIRAPVELRGKVQDFYEYRFNNKLNMEWGDELPKAILWRSCSTSTRG